MILTTVGGSKSSSQRYYAFGAKRGGGTLPTDHRFTGQKWDESGLYYFNARYYDLAIGQFVSPDTVVADPENLFDYDRYMAFRGNPLKMNDPSGHCATLADGSPDLEGDAACWALADEVYNSWAVDPEWWAGGWNISADDWLKSVAAQEYADAAFIQDRLTTFWTPKYHEWGVHHAIYNPAPEWHEPPKHPLETMVDYCQEHDCVTQALDAVATGSAAIAWVCAASIIGDAGCTQIAGTISVAASGTSTARTAYLVTQNGATEADLVMATATFAVGAARGVHPAIGMGSSIVQWAWDIPKPRWGIIL